LHRRTPLSLSIAMAVGLASVPTMAVAAPTETAEAAETPAPKEATGPTTVAAAAEAGDVSAEVDLAREARTADPSAANWRAEAEALDRAGRHAEAAATYQSLLDVLPAEAEAERAEAKARRLRAQERARGVVEGEPKSTHRGELDAKHKAASTSPRPTPPKRRTVEPPPPRGDDERIVTKWYFWVTVGAIVASAAAVTAIAIKAARDDEPDALGLVSAPRPMGPTLLRF
jgi:hypothetical protein